MVFNSTFKWLMHLLPPGKDRPVLTERKECGLPQFVLEFWRRKGILVNRELNHDSTGVQNLAYSLHIVL